MKIMLEKFFEGNTGTRLFIEEIGCIYFLYFCYGEGGG
jgi:hypothetical protein